jgi:hypothetical protein
MLSSVSPLATRHSPLTFKWRTTSLILNPSFFMTSAYPQTDFAKFHFWRTSKKSGGLIRPWLLPLDQTHKNIDNWKVSAEN